MTRVPVLVTGGAGFIGSHACLHLSEAGFLPVVVDNLSTGHADAVNWGPLVRLDLRDRAVLAEVMRTHQIRAVIHFAASAYVGESVHEPGMYYDNNVGGMISLLGAMQDAGVKQLVFSSSCATYGVPKDIPILENSPQEPINPYGRTKLICEQMIADHAAAFGLRYAVLRYFNACGCDPQGRLKERHDPETHLIPLALLAAAGKTAELEVFGTDYDTPDGTCIRDYIHVSDLANAHVLALHQLMGAGENLQVNLGTGHGLSIREILWAIEVVTGKSVPWRAAPRRLGDPPALVADPTLARARLGFIAERSDLHTILLDAAPGFGLPLREAAHA